MNKTKRGTFSLSIEASSNKRGNLKRGQLKISFGMIFSIILIIIFIVFAFYGIKKFLSFQDLIKTKQFQDKFETDVYNMWVGGSGSSDESYFLSKKIKAICFTNDGYDNLLYQSDGFPERVQIDHINLEKITASENPYCIQTNKGEIKLTIKKDYSESLVTITR